MMRHNFYVRNHFADKFLVELKNRIEKETAENPLLRALVNRRDNSEEKAKRDREKEKERERDRDREKRDKKYKKVCLLKGSFIKCGNYSISQADIHLSIDLD